MRSLLLLGCLICSVLVSVNGHGRQQSPAPRTGTSTNVRNGPCGAAAGAPTATWGAGKSVTVKFNIEANHGGTYTYKYSSGAEAQDVFDQNVLKTSTNIGNGNGERSVTLTAPIALGKIVLQWEWQSTEATPYYGCADVEVVAATGEQTDLLGELDTDAEFDGTVTPNDWKYYNFEITETDEGAYIPRQIVAELHHTGDGAMPGLFIQVDDLPTTENFVAADQEAIAGSYRRIVVGPPANPYLVGTWNVGVYGRGDSDEEFVLNVFVCDPDDTCGDEDPDSPASTLVAFSLLSLLMSLGTMLF